MPRQVSKGISYDHMIIGQGLAGSLLAWSLLQAGASVCIVSEQTDCASRVAAGLINPVTGQRFVLAALTPAMLVWCKSFYQDIETKLHIQVFHEQGMLRLYNSEKERLNGEKRLIQDNYQPFLSATDIPEHIATEHSGIKQHQTAWLDTNLLLDRLTEYFNEHPSARFIQDQHFSPNDIIQTGDGVQWHSFTAKQIVFCEGYKLKDNPLFSWLPLQPAHGEIVTCKTSNPLASDIINKSKWLLPTDSHHCKIGATYEPSIQEPTLQASSKRDLLSFAQQLFKTEQNFNCMEHQAGVRPATKDKQPFIGFHPLYPNLLVFNGFGSRGSLMIPWYAHALSNTLVLNAPIPEEANISRFKSLCV